MAKDPERRALLETRLFAVCKVLEIDIDSAMPEWFLEMPMFPTKIETVKNFDRLALMGALQKVQALPAPRDIEKEEAIEIFSDTLKFLTERERAILRMRFGLRGGPRYKLDEVAREFKVSRERVRQIENNACYKIKKAIENRGCSSPEFREAVETIVPHLYDSEAVGKEVVRA